MYRAGAPLPALRLKLRYTKRAKNSPPKQMRSPGGVAALLPTAAGGTDAHAGTAPPRCPGENTCRGRGRWGVGGCGRWGTTLKASSPALLRAGAYRTRKGAHPTTGRGVTTCISLRTHSPTGSTYCLQRAPTAHRACAGEAIMKLLSKVHII